MSTLKVKVDGEKMGNRNKMKNWTDDKGTYLTVVLGLSALTYIPLFFPLSLARILLYGLIAYCVYCRGKRYGRGWVCVFSIAAGFIDVVPGFSLIPFVPTILNIGSLLYSLGPFESESITRKNRASDSLVVVQEAISYEKSN
jgi:hypothetical protein